MSSSRTVRVGACLVARWVLVMLLALSVALAVVGCGTGETASGAATPATDGPVSASPAPSAGGSAPASPASGVTLSPSPGTGGAAEPSPAPLPRFQVRGAMQDIQALEDCGVRSAGSAAEKRGAAYIAARLRAAGAAPEIRTFKLSNGRTSRNVVARFPGATTETVILGAHMDSKAPSPGANDNGSGCGALLEIARCLAEQPAYVTVELVFFGAEEMIDADPDHHHFGSRHHAGQLSRSARRNVAGMISVDMIGVGPSFVVRTMGEGPQSMRRLLLREADERGINLSYLRDPGESGWSDHEAFELAGIPAAWIEWRDDPVYHTAADTSAHIVPAKVRVAGQFVLGVVYGLDEAGLKKLGR